MSMQQFCLRWNNHQPNFISVFSNLLHNETLVDVTLAAEGHHLQAHKVVLSACSSYFQSLFTVNPCQHPIVILKDIKYSDLKIMVDFMYYGEVNVSQEQLPSIIKTAESLKIKGLAEMHSGSFSKWPSDSRERGESCSPSSPQTPSYRGRKRMRKSSTGSNSGSGDKGDEISEITLVATNTIKPEPAIASQETGESVRRPVNTNTESQGSIEEDQISIMSNMESNSAATPVQSETTIQDMNQPASNMSQSSTISQSQAHQDSCFGTIDRVFSVVEFQESSRQVQNTNNKDGQVSTGSSFTTLNPAPSTSSTVQPSSVSATDAETLAGMFPFFNCDNPEGLQSMQTGSGESLNTFDPPLHVKQEIDDSIEMDTNQTEENYTLKSLARDIYLIKHDLARALAMLDILLTRSGVGHPSAAPIESLEHVEALFPLHTDEQLSNLEEMLKHSYIKDDIKRYLLGLGGNTVALATTEILRATITDDLAAQYSWSGLKGKRSLEELEFIKLICGIVQQRIEGATRLDVRARIMAWFKQAEARRNAKRSKTRIKKPKQPNAAVNYGPLPPPTIMRDAREGEPRNIVEPNPSWRM